MATLAVKQSGARQTVELDGDDISRNVRAISLDIEAGQLPTVRVDLAVFELETDTGETKIHLAPGTADLLVRLGWTPPTEEKS